MILDKSKFSDWYNEVIELANLIDTRYPVKGTSVWLPYGLQILKNIDNIIHEELKKYNFQEYYFPLLISELQFAKEKEHIKGFDAQVYWVTKAGSRVLSQKLLLRPTSETSMYPMFSLWIRTHKDLPLKTYQIVNTFRYETKQTRHFIRVREIHFFEAHTCHCGVEEAEKQIQEYFVQFENITKRLAIPYIITRRPDWDKFAGAVYSMGADVLMPSYRTLQIGSMHQYECNFAKPYKIKYEDAKGKYHYVAQTTFGMSERLVAVVIGLHGDSRGLILPPSIAPIEIIIVPIPKKTIKEKLYSYCENIKNMLTNNFRIEIDMRELRPGAKYYDWELKGVPLRFEIGEKEFANNTVVITRRDNLEKTTQPIENLATECRKLLEKIQNNLYLRAKEFLENHIYSITKLEKKKGIVVVGWCGNFECSEKIEAKLNLSILGWKNYKSVCCVCNKATDKIVYVAKTY